MESFVFIQLRANILFSLDQYDNKFEQNNLQESKKTTYKHSFPTKQAHKAKGVKFHLGRQKKGAKWKILFGKGSKETLSKNFRN